jgi:Spx/MgsR family transcriptional regulator
MLEMYGLSNCDTCRRARAWLTQHRCDFRFHDYRADGIDRGLVERLETLADWQSLLNTRGTTWRTLPVLEKTALDRDRAIALMTRHPALIKRPLLIAAGRAILGFSSERYGAEL